MITVYQGIEGDDIAWHLKLLGADITQLPKDILFIPLNNHYGLHTESFVEDTIEQSKNYRAVIFYDIVNSGDWEHPRFCAFTKNFPHPNKHWLTVNQQQFQVQNINIIPWDFMWNRYRAYYTDTPPPGNIHHYAGSTAYQLPDLTTADKKKKFMSLCGREYGYRTHLFDLVKDLDGYISNRTKGIFLEQQDIVGAFVPAPNKFYLNSCLSVYVESNCVRPELIHITEKTYEPLVKGHFILPFSNPGTISRIQTLGFELPDFIDYSYDQEPDVALRFEKFKTELFRLLDLDLYQLHSKHHTMFLHNQQCLKTIPYDNRLLKILNV